MKSVAAFLLPALGAAVPLAGSNGVSDLPDPSEVQIISATPSGNGCPQNSFSTSMSPDRTVVTFGFDSFQVYIGPGISISDTTKNCALHLDLKYPSGFQFAVIDSTYHGFAQLDEGVTATFFSTYFFSTDPSDTTTTQTSITGGVWQDGQVYTEDDQVPTASVVFSPCGASTILTINNRISLSSQDSSASGSITDDDATVALTQQLNLNWRTCNASAT